MMSFEDVASAAGVAAEKALAAAEAAALLATYGGKQMPASYNGASKGGNDFNPISRNSSTKYMPNSRAEYSTIDQSADAEVENEQRVSDGRKMVRRQSYNCQRAPTDIKFDESDCDEEIEMEQPPSTNAGKINRRHSYNVPPAHSGVRYDEYNDDNDEDDEDDADEFCQPARGFSNQPPERPPPQIPARRVHPKLPDYDALAARFEALKHHKTQPR